MIFKKKFAALILMLFAFYSVHAHEGGFFTFPVENDNIHRVVLRVPDGWHDIEEEPISYDLKLKDATDERQCIFWFKKIDDERTSSLLRAVSVELKEFFFPPIKTRTRNHVIQSRIDLCWQSFQIELDNKPHFVGIAVYPINDYIFALILENDKDEETLIDDANAFINNTGLQKIQE